MQEGGTLSAVSAVPYRYEALGTSAGRVPVHASVKDLTLQAEACRVAQCLAQQHGGGFSRYMYRRPPALGRRRALQGSTRLSGSAAQRHACAAAVPLAACTLPDVR